MMNASIAPSRSQQQDHLPLPPHSNIDGSAPQPARASLDPEHHRINHVDYSGSATNGNAYMNGYTNGYMPSSDVDPEKQESQPPPHAKVSNKRGPIRNRIANFQWTWFACTMSTGGVAIAIGNTSHSFHGLYGIGAAFFICELVLFSLFTMLITARFILDPKALWRSLSDPMESFFFGCFWLTQATIIANIELYGVPKCGPWLVKALEVLVWYYSGCALLVVILLYQVHFAVNRFTLDKILPTDVLGIYPILLAGTISSFVVRTQPTTSALPMIIGGIALQGLGFMMAFILFSIIIFRLFTIGPPPPAKRFSLFVMVGAPGYTATSLIGLGTAAKMHFPPMYFGSSVPAGEILSVIAIAIGIWMWLFCFVIFSWAVVSVGKGVLKDGMTFDVSWWATIFPLVGWVVSTALIGQMLQSPGITWVNTGMTIMLVVFWLLIAGFHLKHILTGRSPPP